MAKSPTTEPVEKEEKVPFFIRKALKDQQKLGNINEEDTVVSYSESAGLVTVFTETANFSFEKE